MEEISLRTQARAELIEITDQVQQAVRRAGVADGICTVFVPHTTAGVAINENADPSVRRDIVAELDRLVPRGGDYSHAEGNSDAHIKSALVGSSVQVIVAGGSLRLGVWQGIYLCEFDGPRARQVWVTVR